MTQSELMRANDLKGRIDNLRSFIGPGTRTLTVKILKRRRLIFTRLGLADNMLTWLGLTDDKIIALDDVETITEIYEVLRKRAEILESEFESIGK